MKICFVGHLSSTFVENDYELLKKHFDIRAVDFSTKSPTKLFELIKNVLWADVTFCWFATTSASITVLLSKLFNKKSIVVVGGYDSAYVPELNYGAFLNMKRRIPAKYVLKNADLLLPVSKFTENEVLERVKPKKMIMVYNGINTNEHIETKQKENMITTIGSVTNQGVKLKGLETFTKVSLDFPDYKFIIIGKKDKLIEDKLKKINPKIILTGKIKHEEVRDILMQSQVYCQLSFRESFGVSVAESMFYGCIPIVTNSSALQELVGDTGFYVPYENEELTTLAIQKALETRSEIGQIKERITNNFSLEKRENRLFECINAIYNNLNLKS